jgi:hypothetical protein
MTKEQKIREAFAAHRKLEDNRPATSFFGGIEMDKSNWESRHTCAICGITGRTWGLEATVRWVCEMCKSRGYK